MADWKETLFVWCGDLILEKDGSVMWAGTWVPFAPEEHDSISASSSALIELTDSAFKESENTFRLTVKPPTGAGAGAGAGAGTHTLAGSYLLDNGGGHEMFSDLTHSLRLWALPKKNSEQREFQKNELGQQSANSADEDVDAPPSPVPLHDLVMSFEDDDKDKDKYRDKDLFVAAWGTTEFGPFTSRGYIARTEPGTRTGTGITGADTGITGAADGTCMRMYLARRYLQRKDPREGLVSAAALWGGREAATVADVTLFATTPSYKHKPAQGDKADAGSKRKRR